MSARRVWTITLILLFLGFSLGKIRTYRGAGNQAGAGDRYGTLDSGGRTRTYFIHVPPTYDGKTPWPLVFMLHGGGQSPESAERMSGMSEEADRRNFLVVYPSGTGRLKSMPTWNSGACCTYASDNHVDDIGYLRSLIEKLARDFAVDRQRIYVTGISNGGMMSYRAACELADEIASIAPVEGAQDIECRPSKPVSVIVFHGTSDRLVPFDGGSTPFQIGSRRSDASVADTVLFWVKRDGCVAKPKHQETSAVHIDVYSGCDNGTAVALYAIQGGVHAWPGTRVSRNSVPATSLIWGFFASHPKL
jgi:polyhydroxybutyrate depolymerase